MALDRSAIERLNPVERQADYLAGANYRADEHPALVYLASVSPVTRRIVRSRLHTVARLLSSGRHSTLAMPWASLRYQHVMAMRSQLATDHKAATVNAYLSTVRTVCRHAYLLGHMDGRDYDRIARVGNLKVSGERAGRHIEDHEVKQLFDHLKADRTPLGRRDYALFAVLFYTGLRRFEVCALELDDWDAVNLTLRVRRGKGGKVASQPPCPRSWLRSSRTLSRAGAASQERSSRGCEHTTSSPRASAI
jgi:integrase